MCTPANNNSSLSVMLSATPTFQRAIDSTGKTARLHETASLSGTGSNVTSIVPLPSTLSLLDRLT